MKPVEVHSRYYAIGGLTIQVQADLPIFDDTFHQSIRFFEVNRPKNVNINITHHFTLPQISEQSLGQEVYRKPPWAIYKTNNEWVYLGISSRENDPTLHRVAIFSHNYSDGHIFNPDESNFRLGNLKSLTMFPTDQILLASILPDHQGCILHSAGMILNQNGLLFVGHSDAGKSTITNMLKDDGEILCDDRMIVRRWPEGFRIHGTWSHGDIPTVSPSSAPLRAILFLEQAADNRCARIEDRKSIVQSLPVFVIKPLVTAEWWQKTLDLIGMIARDVPVYMLQFTRDGEVRQTLNEIT